MIKFMDCIFELQNGVRILYSEMTNIQKGHANKILESGHAVEQLRAVDGANMRVELGKKPNESGEEPVVLHLPPSANTNR